MPFCCLKAGQIVRFKRIPSLHALHLCPANDLGLEDVSVVMALANNLGLEDASVLEPLPRKGHSVSGTLPFAGITGNGVEDRSTVESNRL